MLLIFVVSFNFALSGFELRWDRTDWKLIVWKFSLTIRNEICFNIQTISCKWYWMIYFFVRRNLILRTILLNESKFLLFKIKIFLKKRRISVSMSTKMVCRLSQIFTNLGVGICINVLEWWGYIQRLILVYISRIKLFKWRCDIFLW